MPQRSTKLLPAALATGVFCALCAWFSTTRAQAERQHTVRPGQSLEVIAKQYKRTAAELAIANGLSRDVALRGGQVLKVPPDGVIYVTDGQTLSQIAHDHQLGFLELAKANNLKPDAVLKVGQRLTLPGYRPDAQQSASEKRWGKPKQRGQVTLYRIWSSEKLTLKLVDTKGNAKLLARVRMREFLRPRESRKRKLPNSRLMSLLAQVSDHYGGREIHVVSGYRLPGGLTRQTSRHVAGEAIDFRIPGVGLEELRDYCSHFENVGVGFYPRTQFVHLDVRTKPARWTDWSLAGQPAILEKPADLDEAPDDDTPGVDEGQQKANEVVAPVEVAPPAAALPSLPEPPGSPMHRPR